jgi:hypothetical protein
VCYFVSAGARAPARLMTQVFDEQAELDVTLLPSCAPVARVFPAEDQVCLVTSCGCSCDFVGPHKRRPSAESAKLIAAFRRSVVRVAGQLGSVRLLVHRGRHPRQLPAPASILSLTVEEFLQRDRWFIEDVVMEVRPDESFPPRSSS